MLSNNVTLIGNLGSDIELRQLKSGQTVGNVNIAVTRTYTSKAGDTTKETSWFRLVVWAQQAERMAERLRKGDKVLVEGRLQSRSYEAKDGSKREIVEINVSSYQQIGYKNTSTQAVNDNELATAA